MQYPNDCPVCGRHYKTAGWRQSHLENEHPEYRADDTTTTPAVDATEPAQRLGKQTTLVNPDLNSCSSNTLHHDFEFLPSPLRVAGPFARTATVVPPPDNQPRLNDPESATRDVIWIEQHPNQGCRLHYVPTDYESVTPFARVEG
jgi:hypothetical protein